MKEEIIEVPIIIVGTKVRIKPGTRFYGSGSSNPKDMDGHIVKGQSDWISVKWEKGCTNNYEASDLDFINPLEIVKVNKNKIYFEDSELNPKDMNELMDMLYSEGGGLACRTIYKEVDTDKAVEQCKPNKMRSFDDIYYLANAYMPGIEPKDVLKGMLLHKFTEKHLEDKMLYKSFSHCSTMERIRFTNSYNSFNNVLRNIDCSKYKSIYSWRELFAMIDVKSSEDLYEWYKKEFKLEVK